MEMLRVHTMVPRNHRVQITLPDGVPEGPAELVVVVEHDARKPEARQANLLQLLDELRDFRRQFEGRDVWLSDAVIEERREN